jgi:hypothetical protein
MKKIIDLNINYFDPKIDFNETMKKEFYQAKNEVLNMGYVEFVEEKSLPLSPKDQNIFYPLATWRVKNINGKINWVSIYAMALGGMLITDEF